MLVCSVSLFFPFPLNSHIASGLSRLCMVNTTVFSFLATLSDPLSFSSCCWNTSFAELGHHTLSSKVVSLCHQIVEGFQMLFPHVSSASQHPE
jgi:uncharacterized protein (DUF2062 family)